MNLGRVAVPQHLPIKIPQGNYLIYNGWSELPLTKADRRRDADLGNFFQLEKKFT
jgi:hypothetical protein